MSDYRRHHATNVVLVIGSPKIGREVKPGRYPQQQREHWNGPPRRISKAEALRKFLERVNRQNEEVRAFMAAARFAA